MPREDGYKNLVKRTREELVEMGKKGGKANRERIQREKTLNEITKLMFQRKISMNKAREILGEYTEYLDGDLTLGAIVTMRQFIEAQEGSSKAYELLRDTAGYKPTERIESDVTITDGDRSLLEKIAKRTGVTETDG